MIGAVIFTLLTTWKRGRTILNERVRSDTIPLEVFIRSMFHEPPPRVAGTAVFMTTWIDGVPRALLHNLLHNKVLHERVLLVKVDTADVPYVAEAERVQVTELDFGFFQVRIRYGFKDEPDIPRGSGEAKGLRYKPMETSFGRGTGIARGPDGDGASDLHQMFRNARALRLAIKRTASQMNRSSCSPRCGCKHRP